ncbi:MAG: DNA primase [Clostridia bacterium]|nr:DNA primase [Clostridia bacterium]
MAIDPKFIEELKNKNDIVDVVSRYCSLQPRGGSFWACCPLPGHSERTASFHVNQYGQFYKCFGCGRGGDAITFVMEMESLNYVEAVKLLAEKVNMTLPESFKEERRTSEDYRKKEILLSILRDSARFYVANLRSGRAEAHEAYIKKRGLEKETVTAFGIGASLDYNALPEYLKSKGYSYEDMVEAGVVSAREYDGRTEYSDFEAKRLIFPIISAMGDVIAFGGRVLEKTDFGKYKNTKETSLFVKNKTLYNINQIKKQKAAGPIKEIIMVEGYMDTISLFSAGFRNVVASMGTSLTKEQARLLKRYTENVLICYDGDFAGQAANIRGLEILKAEGLNVKVVSLPDGMDPDDVIRNMGAEGYRKCLDEAMPLIDFKLKIVKDKFFDGSAEGRRRYVAEAIKVISSSPSEAEREELLRNVSRETGITYQSLMRDMEKSPESRENAQEPIRQKTANRIVQAERFVLARALWSSKRPLKDVRSLDGLKFSDGYRVEIASYVRDLLSGGIEIKPSLLYDYMADDGREEAEEVLNLLETPVITEDTDDRFFDDCVRLIKTNALEEKLKELKARADEETDAAARAEVTREIAGTMAEIRKLQK